MASRSPSRGRYRSRTRSPTPRSASSRSPDRRRRYESRSPTRSRSPAPSRRNGRGRSGSRSWSRGRDHDGRERSASAPPMKSTKIVVERLSKNINEDHLREIFGQFGRIKDLDLPINRTFGTNRGTAYILYDFEGDAERAIAHMHEAQVDGAVINLDEEQTSTPGSPSRDRVEVHYNHLAVAARAKAVVAAVACHRRVDSDHGQTCTVQGLAPHRDHQEVKLLLEEAVADTEVVPTTLTHQDHGPGLLLQGDVAVVAMTMKADAEAPVGAVTIAIATEADLAVAAEVAIDEDENVLRCV
ncbi:Fc.00g038020.m01.CDS01 [Cosmosporella sp. VM-42]